jgi:hypothetical protein
MPQSRVRSASPVWTCLLLALAAVSSPLAAGDDAPTSADDATTPVSAGDDATAPLDSALADTAEVAWVLGDSIEVPSHLRGEALRNWVAEHVTLNPHATLALHAEPHAARTPPEVVTRKVVECDSLRTAIPPGDWDIFVIARDFDHVAGAMFCFEYPEDWVVHGFRTSPLLRSPFQIGGLKAQDQRPRLLVFSCVADPEHTNMLLPGTPHDTAEVVVLGGLEVTATTPGSITIVPHGDERYGQPEISTCFSTTLDLDESRLGRVDVGRGPGKRPCASVEGSD